MCAKHRVDSTTSSEPRSKAARRRQRGRVRHLRAVYEENPEAFEDVWLDRLASFIEQFNPDNRAGKLVHPDGRREPTVFRAVDYALKDLACIGDDVYAEYESITRQYVEERCCRAMADAVYSRLYPSGRDLETSLCRARTRRGPK